VVRDTVGRPGELEVSMSVECDTLLVLRRSVVVRTLVSTGELSLSCARLLAGWMTTLWLSRPLSVSHQLSHPSLNEY